MLKRNTVFVVGAGASKEFNLPVGAELAIKISEKLDIVFDRFGREVISGDGDLFRNVTRLHNQELSQYQKAAWLIRDGIILAHSIDDFLDVHQHDGRVVNYGKAAIAKCVLEAEAKSLLFFDRYAQQLKPGPRTINFRNCADTWLVGLMRLLGRGTPHAERAKIFDRCTFVIFNYDRCVEHFFVHALQRFYNISEEEAVEIVATARIYHPYGLVGELGNATSTGGMAPFGAEQADCYEIGKTMLKTYTESVESIQIKKAISASEQIVFLGFAYHDQNMRLLAESQSLDRKEFIGTAYKISPDDISTIKQQIDAWEKRPPSFTPPHYPNIDINSTLKAADIFNHYSKSL
jgi:hypothetical protein